MKSLKKITIACVVALLFVAFVVFRVNASDFHFDNVKIEDIKINNTANVQNTTQTTANTGGNTTTATGGNATNTVTTGNAGAQANVTNCVNTTAINGTANCGTASPTNAPSATPVPATPTPGNGSGGGSNGGGGSSSSSSGGGSSSGGSSGSSNATAVLGASTFAGTGTFAQNLMNSMAFAGMIVLSLGGLSYAKEKKH